MSASDVAAHYTSGDLMERLRAALRDDGVDPDRPTIEALAAYDHFHGRGPEATEEIAGLAAIGAGDHVLDVGSGIGGPARFFAHRFGCRVTGIDLTEEFCAVARALTRQLGMADRVVFEQGDALAMPFGAGAFDGAYSMNVAMNIADKGALYREIRRVLKSRAWLVLSEVAQGPDGAPDYPTPWARTAATSFLVTPEATRQGLEDAGFKVVAARDTTEAWLAYGVRSRVLIDRGEQSPNRAATLIHGEGAAEANANTARALAEGRIVAVEFLCARK